MVGSSQSAFKLWWAVVQGDLTGREEVGLTSVLLLDDLCLQIPHDVAMLPLEGLSLRGPLGHAPFGGTQPERPSGPQPH